MIVSALSGDKPRMQPTLSTSPSISQSMPLALACALACGAATCASGCAANAVSVRERLVSIPTYALGAPDRYPPLFDENVYPYPLQTALGGRRQARRYRVIELENEYIRVWIAPELGGKIYAAHDKTDGGADFIYHNRVVKPALVGLRGAWVSGGVEWNFPSFGHTVNTFEPLPHRVIRRPDGSVTVYVGTTEWVRRMRWTVAITVEPGRALIHHRARLANPTLTHNRAYYWVNGAVHVGTKTRITLPTDAVVSGRRRSPLAWPRRGGRDLSWWRNTAEPMDYFAAQPSDFVGAYHVDQDRGTVHFAPRRESPGKKYWTWGTAREGAMWEPLLTDADGPYIELQSGRHLSQRDTWIFEPRHVEQVEGYWYPVRGIGGISDATVEGALHVADEGAAVVVGAYTTRSRRAELLLLRGGQVLARRRLTLSPVAPKRVRFPVALGKIEQVVLLDAGGATLVRHRTAPRRFAPMERQPLFFADATTAEGKALAGYYAYKDWNARRARRLLDRAVAADPDQTRARRLLGLLSLKAGRWASAREHFERVLARDEDDAAARYYRVLADLALRRWGRVELDLARLSARAGHARLAALLAAMQAMRAADRAGAVAELRRVVALAPSDAEARALLAALIAEGQPDEARRLLDGVLVDDPLHPLALIERRLAGLGPAPAQLFGQPQVFVEAAIEYARLSLLRRAVGALRLYLDRPGARPSPLHHLYLGHYLAALGDRAGATAQVRRGAGLPIEGVFPFRRETLAVLARASRLLGAGAGRWRLRYYRGTLLAALRRYQDAYAELQRAGEHRHPLVGRNLGLLARDKLGRRRAAVSHLRAAVRRAPTDHQLYAELDRSLALLGEHGRRGEGARPRPGCGSPPAVGLAAEGADRARPRPPEGGFGAASGAALHPVGRLERRPRRLPARAGCHRGPGD